MLTLFIYIAGMPISVSQAVQLGLLTSDQQTFYNPATNERVSIDEAISTGMVKAEKKPEEVRTDSRKRVARKQEQPQVPTYCFILFFVQFE